MELPLFYKEKMQQVLKDEYEDYIKSFERETSQKPNEIRENFVTKM